GTGGLVGTLSARAGLAGHMLASTRLSRPSSAVTLRAAITLLATFALRGAVACRLAALRLAEMATLARLGIAPLATVGAASTRTGRGVSGHFNLLAQPFRRINNGERALCQPLDASQM